MDATDGALKAQECRSCGGGDDEHCVNERCGGAAEGAHISHTRAVDFAPASERLFAEGRNGRRAREARERGELENSKVTRTKKGL